MSTPHQPQQRTGGTVIVRSDLRAAAHLPSRVRDTIYTPHTPRKNIMNTLTAPQRSDRRDVDVADTLQRLPLTDRTPRTSIPDRVALRIALALLLWSTRPSSAVSSADSRRAARERELRERRWRLDLLRLPLL